ncbi:hypothetical protein GTO27_11675 [Candidatus Bathyarchaeota archaeon]|nr:hypothetical protein [Candidatus Bathyarchaeota archaeon]
MRPKPDFERFIRILLGEHGYEVTPNQIIKGKCVEHEVDAVARKVGETYIIEVKHHFNYHALTGLDESRIASAVFEDAIEGFKLGLSDLKIDRAMIVCNTKFSEHANLKCLFFVFQKLSSHESWDRRQYFFFLKFLFYRFYNLGFDELLVFRVIYPDQ